MAHILILTPIHSDFRRGTIFGLNKIWEKLKFFKIKEGGGGEEWGKGVFEIFIRGKLLDMKLKQKTKFQNDFMNDFMISECFHELYNKLFKQPFLLIVLSV